MVSSAYLRLLIFLPTILIPACASSSPAFLRMYSAYKLNKQSDSIQPWHNPFQIWNQSFVPCPVVAVASWPAYRFLRRQVRWLPWLPGGSDGKASVYNVGDLGSSPGLGRSLEKEMAIHSSTIAWKIPWTEEPGRLQSMGSQRVGHDWATSVCI